VAGVCAGGIVLSYATLSAAFAIGSVILVMVGRAFGGTTAASQPISLVALCELLSDSRMVSWFCPDLLQLSNQAGSVTLLPQDHEVHQRRFPSQSSAFRGSRVLPARIHEIPEPAPILLFCFSRPRSIFLGLIPKRSKHFSSPWEPAFVAVKLIAFYGDRLISPQG
jgi:hypothetical protein